MIYLMVKAIEVYVCPTPDCADYYGTTGMKDLHKEFTGPKIDDQGVLAAATGSPYRHTRAECPSCRGRGKQVERVRVRVAVEVSETDAVATPDLPTSNAVLASR